MRGCLLNLFQELVRPVASLPDYMRRGVQDGAFKDATQVRVTAPPFEVSSKDSPLRTESPL